MSGNPLNHRAYAEENYVMPRPMMIDVSTITCWNWSHCFFMRSSLVQGLLLLEHRDVHFRPVTRYRVLSIRV